ncbi:MAG: hypothetical protein WCD43_19450 [Candidatus Acidiferrales bacterium]
MLHDYGVLGWVFNPFAELVDVRIGVHGFDDGGRCDFDDFRAFDNRFQGDADGFSAASENSGGVDVAVNGGMVGDAVFAGDLVRAAPAEELVFDGFAVGMATDVAAAGVRAHGRARFRLGGATGFGQSTGVELPVLRFSRDRRSYDFGIAS